MVIGTHGDLDRFHPWLLPEYVGHRLWLRKNMYSANMSPRAKWSVVFAWYLWGATTLRWQRGMLSGWGFGFFGNGWHKCHSCLISGFLLKSDVVSINKDVTAISYSSLPNMNFWAQRTPRKSNACYPMAIELLALLASTEELCEMWKEAAHWPHIAKIHTKGMISVSQNSCIFPYI